MTIESKNAIKDTVTLTRPRKCWGIYCTSGWSGMNINECPQFEDEIQSDENCVPYCEMWGLYLENDEKDFCDYGKEHEPTTHFRPLRCAECMSTSGDAQDKNRGGDA